MSITATRLPEKSEGTELGHRLTRKGRATRDRIVAAAAEVVGEQGIGRTTLDDIQKAAHVSASQLYHYFEDRHALIRAVIEYRSTEVLGGQRSVLDRLDSFEALERWRDVMVESRAANNGAGGCPLGSLVGDLAERDPEAREDLDQSFELWEDLLRSGLRSMSGNGTLPSHLDVDRMALALLAAVQGGLLLSQARRSTAPLEAALDTSIGHLRLLAA